MKVLGALVFSPKRWLSKLLGPRAGPGCSAHVCYAAANEAAEIKCCFVQMLRLSTGSSVYSVHLLGCRSFSCSKWMRFAFESKLIYSFPHVIKLLGMHLLDLTRQPNACTSSLLNSISFSCSILAPSKLCFVFLRCIT